jgi:hypothetical protein
MVLNNTASYEAAKFGYPNIIKDVQKGNWFFKVILDLVQVESPADDLVPRRGRAIRTESTRIK